MKQQYSLTSIWYWSLNSVAFVVATFGTVKAIVPSFQPSSPVSIPSQPVKEPFNLSFNPYKPNHQLNKPNNQDFRLSLLPVPSAESQKCQVFSCLPPNPFHNLDSQQDDLPSSNLQQSNYRYTSSNIKSYKLDKLSKLKNDNLNSPLENSDNNFISVIPIPSPRPQINIPIKSQNQTKPPTISSGIFPHTYEVYSTSKSVSLPQTQAVTPEVKKIVLTVGNAVYLALGNGTEKNTPIEPSYKWNDTSIINQSNQIDIKLSLTKDTDKKIARINELIKRQDSRNALNSKITNVILTYHKLVQAQEKVKIAELSLKNAEALVNNTTAPVDKIQYQLNLTKNRVAMLAARNEVEARRLELSSILEIDRKTQIAASEIPVIQPVSLDLKNLQQIALQNQPNYLRNQLNFEISKLTQSNEAIKDNTLKNTAFQLDTHLKNSIYYINSIYSQIEGAQQAVKLSEQLLNVEQEKSQLGKSSQSQLISRIDELDSARNKKLELTIRYLNALTNLDQLVGTTLKTWQISI